MKNEKLKFNLKKTRLLFSQYLNFLSFMQSIKTVEMQIFQFLTSNANSYIVWTWKIL